MEKNEILAHPASFPADVLIRAILDRNITVEEIALSGDVEVGILKILQEEEEQVAKSDETVRGSIRIIRRYEERIEEFILDRLRPELKYRSERMFRKILYEELQKNGISDGRTFEELMNRFEAEAGYMYLEPGRFVYLIRGVPLSRLVMEVKHRLTAEAYEEIREKVRIWMEDLRREAENTVTYCTARSEREDIVEDVPEAPSQFLPDPFIGSSWFKRFFSRNKKRVYAALYAPKSIPSQAGFRVQVHLYSSHQAAHVAKKAKSLDADAALMDCNPLGMNLKKGAHVTVSLSFSANPKEVSLDKTSVDLIWMGEPVSAQFFVKTQFFGTAYLTGEATIDVEGVPVGTLSFMTVVNWSDNDRPTPVVTRVFRKVFISYAHEDVKTASAMASAYRAQGISYFFDHHSLESGAVFDEEIMRNIEESDLFLLLWSQHAAQSEYVEKEYLHALQFAYPQKDKTTATLWFRPFSVEPFADPPARLKSIYNFTRLTEGVS